MLEEKVKTNLGIQGNVLRKTANVEKTPRNIKVFPETPKTF